MSVEHEEITFKTYSERIQQDSLTWKILFPRQLELLEGKACQEFIDAIQKLKNLIQYLPNIKALSKTLHELVGWKLYPVAGLLEAKEYFQLLADKHHPVSTSLREYEHLDYSPFPDMWHDIFGHLPLLLYPVYGDFLQYIAQKWLVADDKQKRQLSNVYWYTIEAGVCTEKGERRVYGASQLSSRSEIKYAVSNQVIIENFNLEKIVKLSVNIHEMQSSIFEISDFEYLAIIKDGIEEIIKS